MCHAARTLARISLAEGALGRWVDAEAHLREAMAQLDQASGQYLQSRSALLPQVGLFAHQSFQTISLHDDVELRPTDGAIEVRCDHPGVPGGHTNLAHRAAEELRRFAGIAKGVSITITKRIPVAGGLGGGSSNAATVLIGLDRLWRLGLGPARIGLLFGGAAVASAVMPFVFGPLTDRWGGQRLTLVGLLVTAAWMPSSEPSTPATIDFQLIKPPSVSNGTCAARAPGTGCGRQRPAG